MSRKSAISSIYIVIFLMLSLTFLLCVRPSYKLLTESITGRVNAFRSELENRTGLTFSYSSMSPSILTVFNIKGIVLSSSSDGTEIIRIRKIVLRYSLWHLLRKDMEHAFKYLTIDGIDVDYDDSSDRKIADKLIAIAEQYSQGMPLNLEDILVKLPVSVTVKNVSVRYRRNGAVVSAVFKKISAGYNSVNDTLALSAAGNAACTLKQFPGADFSGKFSVSGGIRTGLDGSSFLARFSNFNGGDFSFGKQNFLFSYNNRTVTARTIQNSYPLLLSCSYGIDSGDVNLTVHTEGLSVSSFVSSRGQHRNLVQKIASVSASVNADISYNTHTKKLAYTSNGHVYLPGTLVPGAVTVSYKLSGNEKNIHIPNLVLSGRNYDAGIAVSCIFDGIRLSGTADIRRIVLPNGGVISAELFFDPQKRGFLCFSPQVFLNDKALTALQLTVIPHKESVDYSFEVSDYAHADADNPGKIQIDGSYLIKTNYVQAGVTVSDIYLDSVAQAAAFFMPENTAKSLSSFSQSLVPYMFTGEFYLSSDMKSLSYNIPYALVANTEKDNQFLLMSLDGNGTSLQVSKFDVIYGKNTIHASAEVDKAPDSQGAFFSFDMTTGNIPYHFTGTVMGNFITIAGDYGTSLQVQRSSGGEFEGSLIMDNFPVNFADSIFTLSTETGFAYTAREGLAVNISRFEAENAGAKFSFAPKLLLSGKITKYGAFFDSISYSDIYSTLNGSAQLLLNMNENLFDSAHLDFSLKNPVASEKIAISADVTNPDDTILNGDTIRNNLYFNAQLVCTDFGLNRFVSEQSDNNALTAAVTATGTINNPYIALNVDSASMMIGGSQCLAGGNASIVEKKLVVDSMHVKYGTARITDIKADISLETYEGTASAELEAGSGESFVSLPLNLAVSDTIVKKDRFVPDSFAATLSSPGFGGTLLKKSFPFSLTLLHSGGNTSVFSSENLGITGQMNDSGLVHISIAEDKPFHCSITGNTKGKNLDIAVSGIYADMGELLSYLPATEFRMYSGIMSGDVKISGLQSDPEFTGSLLVTKPDFSLPKIVPSHITTDKFTVTLLHNEISVPQVEFKEHNESVFAEARIYFDRWSFDRIEASVKTEPGHVAPADLDVGVAEFKGLTSINLGINFQNNILDVSGRIYVEDVKAQIRAAEIASALNEKMEDLIFFTRTDLDIVIGPHVNFFFDPLIRCVLVPKTSANFKMDQSENMYSLKGDVNLKSGDIAYLNRNFYIKQGTIKFNDADGRINPRITVRAETRERDEDGNEIRIVLSADNQYLSDFNPVVTSIPAKSEAEIRELLGQIAVGDSTNVSGLLFAASDYAIQSTVGRAFENKLRDLMNFDIFSVRTMFLQNTLKMGFAGTLTPSQMTVGNFLDNSTVYIGKYFGSAVYADALIHLSYDKTRVDDKTTAQGLMLQPEFGLELESPFATIRWSMAPNIDAMLNNMIISSTSLTLSWKFSF
jgi:hypothetical protein